MKCQMCQKEVEKHYTVTDIDKGKAVNKFNVCESCAETLKKQTPKKGLDLTNIETPEQLLTLIEGFAEILNPGCQCGLSYNEFMKKGRIGCMECYNQFREKINAVALAYHGSNTHVGKIPKHQATIKIESDPKEKLKLLKLQYAKALELEEYEKLDSLNKEIIQLLSLAFEDQ